MNIKILATGISAKESFIHSLEEYGFDINRLARLTEAVFSRDHNYTIVTITDEGDIVIFSKLCTEEAELDYTEPTIAFFEAPKTSIGYKAALTETKKAISF